MHDGDRINRRPPPLPFETAEAASQRRGTPPRRTSSSNAGSGPGMGQSVSSPRGSAFQKPPRRVSPTRAPELLSSGGTFESETEGLTTTTSDGSRRRPPRRSNSGNSVRADSVSPARRAPDGAAQHAGHFERPEPDRRENNPIPNRSLESRPGMTAQQAEDQQLRTIFAEIDSDGSGTLSKTEVNKMLKGMGEKTNSKQLRSIFQLMMSFSTSEPRPLLEEGEEDTVTFEQFKKWWFRKAEDERKDARTKAKEIFDAIDLDKGGTLDKNEMAKMAVMLQRQFPRIKLVPPFDLESDFKMMQLIKVEEEVMRKETKIGDFAEELGDVSFPQFQTWWKQRTGDDAPNIPVLPESMVLKIHDVIEGKIRLPALPPPGQRTGKQLWDFMRPRLMQLVELEKNWGQVHSLYPTMTTVSAYEDKVIPMNVIDPDSNFCTNWDAAQVAILMYISFSFPFKYAMDLENTPQDPVFWFEAALDIYFYADLFICFRTAYWTTAGVLEVDINVIRAHYLRGWFSIDAISCLPINYVTLLIQAIQGQDASGGGGMRMLKTLRLLRLAKLMRIARLKKLMQKYEDLFDASQWMGMAVTLFVIMFVSHLMACVWYMIGQGEELGADGEIMQGWVHNPDAAGWSKEDLEQGCDTDIGCAVPLGRRYWISMYSSFALNYDILLTDEHYFCLMSILVTGFIYGALAGVISTLLMGFAAGDQEFGAKLQSLKAWMSARNLKKPDRSKILAYYRAASKGSKSFNEAEILSELPPSLGGDISSFLYGDILKGLPMFRSLGKECITRLCHVVVPMSVLRGQMIMEQYKVGTEMYFVIDGEVEISQNDERLGFLGKGSFFGEHPMLESIYSLGGNNSTVRTRTVRATRNSDMGFLRIEDVLEVLEEFPELVIRIRQFHSVGKRISKKNQREINNMQRMISVNKMLEDGLVSESSTLHVRGIGGATLESAEGLKRYFGTYGDVVNATVRHREENGQNTSWALVAFKDAASVDAALQQAERLSFSNPDTNLPLKLSRFSTTIADASDGRMKDTRAKLLQAAESLEERILRLHNERRAEIVKMQESLAASMGAMLEQLDKDQSALMKAVKRQSEAQGGRLP